MSEDAKNLRESRKEELETVRPVRTPLHGRRILTTDEERPGKHCCWVSDSDALPGGIQRFLDAGYTHVPKSGMKIGDPTVNDSRGVGSVVTRNGGRGVTLYLMEIDQEFYDADMQAMEDERLAVEAQIFDPNIGEGQYGVKKQ